MVSGPFPACAMAAVHLHPRATEAFIVTKGRIITEMVPETAARNADGSQRVIRTELGQDTMTLFPQGAFHTSINPTCDAAHAVVVFDSVDSGFENIAYQFFSLSNTTIADTTNQAIVGEDIETIKGIVPDAAIAFSRECQIACGLI
jgi:oxalate decarboxylase/phosphoglucose isomerase-like protein (cupin superfamily)